jgi:hypothetical protein
MGIPQVPEQIRRAPILALRAVFAGIGRIVLSADRPEAQNSQSVSETGTVSQLSAQEHADRVDAPTTEAAPATDAPTTDAAPTAAGLGTAGQTTGTRALPLDNYDSLSLASIRARLRGLDVGQLKGLLDYEAQNAERPDVLGMFERRIEKLESGG